MLAEMDFSQHNEEILFKNKAGEFLYFLNVNKSHLANYYACIHSHFCCCRKAAKTCQ